MPIVGRSLKHLLFHLDSIGRHHAKFQRCLFFPHPQLLSLPKPVLPSRFEQCQPLPTLYQAYTKHMKKSILNRLGINLKAPQLTRKIRERASEV